MHADQPRELNRQLNQSHGSFELVVSPAILALIGFWVDRAVGITPILTIVFGLTGLIGATIRLYMDYQAKMAKLAVDRRGHSDHSAPSDHPKSALAKSEGAT